MIVVIILVRLRTANEILFSFSLYFSRYSADADCTLSQAIDGNQENEKVYDDSISRMRLWRVAFVEKC